MWSSLILILSSAIMLQFVPNFTDACSCMAPNEPHYCHTDFFALVEIQEEEGNDGIMINRYKFRPISVIHDKGKLLSVHRYLYTSAFSSTCGVYLKVGERYLIGGNLNRATNRLTLNLCNSYVEQQSAAKVINTKEFQSIMENCNESEESEEVETRYLRPSNSII